MAPNPLVVAVLCALFASSFAGQGARMMMDGHAGLSIVLYLVAAAVCLFGVFWFKIRSQIWIALSKSIDRYSRNALTWVFLLVLLLTSLSFSPLMLGTKPTELTSPIQSADISDQLRQLQYERSITIGRTTFFNLQNGLSSLPSEFKATPSYFVIVSSATENLKLAEDLNALFYLAWAKSRGPMKGLSLPSYARDLDAPRFEGKGLPGITIHGSDAITDFIAQRLDNCFQIRRTAEMPSGVAEYYSRIYPTTISTNDVFIWLEIGKGHLGKAHHVLARVTNIAFS